MELESKHLAPYLPYNLKCQVTDKRKKKIATLGGLYNDGNCVFHDTIESEKGFKRIKPLLFPMSSLYTEMEDGTVPMKVIGEMLGYDLKKYTYDDGDVFYGFDLTDTSIPYKVPMEDREIYFIYFDTQSHWFYMVNQFLEVDSDCEHIPFSLEVADYLDSLHFDVYGLIDKGLALDKTKKK